MKKRVIKLLARAGKTKAFYLADPADIYYFTGFSGTFARVIAGEKKCFFVTDQRYEGEAEKLNLKKPFEIIIIRGFKPGIKKILSPYKKILTGENLPLADYLFLKNLNKTITFSKAAAEMRMIKDKNEIKLIKKSVSIASAAFRHIINILKPGVTEKDLALEFARFAGKKGADSVSFRPIVAFNENSAVPHHQTSLKKLKQNTLILVDAGVKYRGYSSDLTRCIAFSIINSRLREIKKHYNAVKKAGASALRGFKAGESVSKAAAKAVKSFEKQGLEKYFTHSPGHGLGLDVHEQPAINTKTKGFFRKNSVVTCEPGIYFKGKYGIRIENDYLITDSGPEKIPAISDRLINAC